MIFKEKMFRFFKAAWEYIKHAKIELLVLAGALAIDLISKGIIESCMTVGQSITVIPNFFNLTYILNTKAAFGSAFGLEKLLGDEGIRIFFLVITSLAVVLFSVFMYKWRSKNILGRIGIALIIGGALGNFYDRLFLSAVRDFAEIVFFGLDLPLLGKSFAIFNIADMALIGGVVVFIIFFIFYLEDKKTSKPVAAAETEGGSVYEIIGGEGVSGGEGSLSEGDSERKNSSLTRVAAETAPKDNQAKAEESLAFEPERDKDSV